VPCDFSAISDDFLCDRNENDGGGNCDDDVSEGAEGDITADVARARERGKPFRVCFRCTKVGEKALWIEAFVRLNRLSSENRAKKAPILTSIMSSVRSMTGGPISPTRKSDRQLEIAKHTRKLALENSFEFTRRAGKSARMQYIDVERLAQGERTSKNKDKEFRVGPPYTYPHRWMTKDEMKEEMNLPSKIVHDLRVPGCEGHEIGSLKVEVLQCLGLPKMDQFSETDAVAYLVCGQYAFATDTIQDRANPMWLVSVLRRRYLCQGLL